MVLTFCDNYIRKHFQSLFQFHSISNQISNDGAEFDLSLSTLSTRGHNMNIVMKRQSSKYVSRAFNYRVAKL